MHFAYPPRKSSNPPPFRPRSSNTPLLRRRSVKTVALIALAVITAVWLLLRLFSNGPVDEPKRPSGDPPVVLVTVVDEAAYGRQHTDSVRENRERYASFHGYKTMIASVGDYDLEGSPLSWNKVVALRHALARYPGCRYLWFVDQDSYIMEPTLSLEKHLMDSDRLDSVMLREKAVVPPDSIIKTFGHVKAENIDFVVTQDREGLSTGSFVLRNGDWAKFFLEMWYDPLYRSYNFQKAEGHALEHMVQWHPTMLSKLALVPMELLNSYNRYDKGERIFKKGDLVVRAAGCVKNGEGERTCESELAGYKSQWQKAFDET